MKICRVDDVAKFLGDNTNHTHYAYFTYDPAPQPLYDSLETCKRLADAYSFTKMVNGNTFDYSAKRMDRLLLRNGFEGSSFRPQGAAWLKKHYFIFFTM